MTGCDVPARPIRTRPPERWRAGRGSRIEPPRAGRAAVGTTRTASRRVRWSDRRTAEIPTAASSTSVIARRRWRPPRRIAAATPRLARIRAPTPGKKTLTSVVRRGALQAACKRLDDTRYPAGVAENWATISSGRNAPSAANLRYGNSTGSASSTPRTLPAAMAATDRTRALASPTMATSRLTKTSQYSDVAAVSATTTAKHPASRAVGRSASRSAKYQASGRPHAWAACRCGRRVSKCTLNAARAPAREPPAIEPVHLVATTPPASAVSVSPASSERLNARTGEPPSHRAGAPTRAGMTSGSEYVRVRGSGAKMFPSKRRVGCVGRVWAIQLTIHSFNWASELSLSDRRHGARPSGHV